MQDWKKWLAVVMVAGGVSAAFAVTMPLIATEEAATEEVATEETGADRAEQSPQDAGDSKAVLDGAMVFAWTCGSCHSERYPKEHTDTEWDMIVTHMRVRANLTGEQAEAVLHYLKENNE
jgi:cytochrome c5